LAPGPLDFDWSELGLGFRARDERGLSARLDLRSLAHEQLLPGAGDLGVDVNFFLHPRATDQAQNFHSSAALA